jgi:hypothetical protein
MERKITSVGLCAECRHSRTVQNDRGSTFWRCGLADTVPGFAKYPVLPVLECIGFAARMEPEKEESE